MTRLCILVIAWLAVLLAPAEAYDNDPGAPDDTWAGYAEIQQRTSWDFDYGEWGTANPPYSAIMTLGELRSQGFGNVTLTIDPVPTDPDLEGLTPTRGFEANISLPVCPPGAYCGSGLIPPESGLKVRICNIEMRQLSQ